MIKRLTRNFRILFYAFLGIQGLAVSAQTIGFTDGYEIEGWDASEIAGGTTEITGVSILNAEFTYTVRLAGGGVTSRTADYTVTVPNSGTITFDWAYTGNHRFFQAFEEFHVIVNGEEVATPLAESSSSGNFNYSGFDQAVSVEAGDTFGFRIGGRNFDSNSELDGLLSISNFRVVETATPGGLGLIISKNEVAPDTFDFQWSSRNGRVYDLLSSTDLSVPVENWTVWEGQLDILSDGEMTQIQAIASGGPRRFFVVVEKPAP